MPSSLRGPSGFGVRQPSVAQTVLASLRDRASKLCVSQFCERYPVGKSPCVSHIELARTPLDTFDLHSVYEKGALLRAPLGRSLLKTTLASALFNLHDMETCKSSKSQRAAFWRVQMARKVEESYLRYMTKPWSASCAAGTPRGVGAFRWSEDRRNPLYPRCFSAQTFPKRL